MNRVANYTIKGFLYQFNITLLAILDSQENSTVTVEGLIEDIDIESDDKITAIQCKYHESEDTFVLSSIYEPLLQMMVHFKNNPHHCIGYSLYAHFPNEPIGNKQLSISDLNTIISSSDKSLNKYTSCLTSGFDVSTFHKQFVFIIGHSFEKTVEDVQQKFIHNGLSADDVDILIYPNALTIIGDLSIQKDESRRKIKKADLLEKLQSIKTVAISRWSSALKSYHKLLQEKRKQLKVNLDKNSRLRHIFISQEIENFSHEIVIFLQDFLQKFHFKLCHLHTPLFCFDCDNVLFQDICRRLIAKKIKINDGALVGNFNKSYFLREPIVNPKKKLREFDLRITILEVAPDILSENICDDLYLVTSKNDINATPLDVNIERMAVKTFQELRYILGMDKTYE